MTYEIIFGHGQMNIVCHFYLFVKRDPFPQVQGKNRAGQFCASGPTGMTNSHFQVAALQNAYHAGIL